MTDLDTLRKLNSPANKSTIKALSAWANRCPSTVQKAAEMTARARETARQTLIKKLPELDAVQISKLKPVAELKPTNGEVLWEQLQKQRR